MLRFGQTSNCQLGKKQTCPSWDVNFTNIASQHARISALTTVHHAAPHQVCLGYARNQVLCRNQYGSSTMTSTQIPAEISNSVSSAVITLASALATHKGAYSFQPAVQGLSLLQQLLEDIADWPGRAEFGKVARLPRDQADRLSEAVSSAIRGIASALACCHETFDPPVNTLAAVLHLHHVHQAAADILKTSGVSDEEVTDAYVVALRTLLLKPGAQSSHSSSYSSSSMSSSSAAASSRSSSSSGTGFSTRSKSGSGGRSASSPRPGGSDWNVRVEDHTTRHSSNGIPSSSREGPLELVGGWWMVKEEQMAGLITALHNRDAVGFHDNLWTMLATRAMIDRNWHLSDLLSAAPLMLSSLAKACMIGKKPTSITSSGSSAPRGRGSSPVPERFKDMFSTSATDKFDKLMGLKSDMQEVESQKHGVFSEKDENVSLTETVTALMTDLPADARGLWRRIHHETFHMTAHRISVLQEELTALKTGAAFAGDTTVSVTDFLTSLDPKVVSGVLDFITNRDAYDIKPNRSLSLMRSDPAYLVDQLHRKSRAAQQVMLILHEYNQLASASKRRDAFKCTTGWMNTVCEGMFLSMGNVRMGGATAGQLDTRGALKLFKSLYDLHGELRYSLPAYILKNIDQMVAADWETALENAHIITRDSNEDTKVPRSSVRAYGAALAVGEKPRKQDVEDIMHIRNCPEAAEAYVDMVWGLNDGSLDHKNDNFLTEKQRLKAAMDVFNARVDLSDKEPAPEFCIRVQASLTSASFAATAKATEAAYKRALGQAMPVSRPVTPNSDEPDLVDVLHAQYRVLTAVRRWQEAGHTIIGFNVETLLSDLYVVMASLPPEIWQDLTFMSETYPDLIRLVTEGFGERPESMLVDRYLKAAVTVLDQATTADWGHSFTGLSRDSVSGAAPSIRAEQLNALLKVTMCAPEYVIPDILPQVFDRALLQMVEGAAHSQYIRAGRWANIAKRVIALKWDCPLFAAGLLQLAVNYPSMFERELSLNDLAHYVQDMLPNDNLSEERIMKALKAGRSGTAALDRKDPRREADVNLAVRRVGAARLQGQGEDVSAEDLDPFNTTTIEQLYEKLQYLITDQVLQSDPRLSRRY